MIQFLGPVPIRVAHVLAVQLRAELVTVVLERVGPVCAELVSNRKSSYLVGIVRPNAPAMAVVLSALLLGSANLRIALFYCQKIRKQT